MNSHGRRFYFGARHAFAAHSLAALWFALFLSGCQTSPVGRQQLVLVPLSVVDEQGTKAFEEIKLKEQIDLNESNNAYVKCVANSITATLDDSRPWEVVVFKSDQINAFALPGGKIGVYSGLLNVAKTPDQLAAVIGHEIGHVVAQHGRERISHQQVTNGVFGVVSTLFDDRESGVYRSIMAGLGLGVQVGVLLPFARVQESEADDIGLELMAKSGFDPRQAVVLWKNMEKTGNSKPLTLLSTHPSHRSRIRDIQRNMDDALDIFDAVARRPSCHPI